MQRRFSTVVMAAMSMIGGALAVAALNTSCGEVVSDACAMEECPAGPAGPAGPPGDSYWTKTGETVSYLGNVGIRRAAEVALDVQGDTRITGTLRVGAVFIAKPDCKVEASNAFTDCTCPAGTIALAGGAAGNFGEFLRESRPLSATSWRVACTDASGKAIPCGSLALTCARLGN